MCVYMLIGNKTQNNAGDTYDQRKNNEVYV